CYAERAPRRRDLAYQAEFCYSTGFASCSVFLAWAARNAAEPAYVTEAARAAWASGIAAPEDGGAGEMPASPFAWGAGADPDQGPEASSPEAGLFGPLDTPDGRAASAADEHGWVSAAAWAAAPWDPLAEAEAEEIEALSVEEVDLATDDDELVVAGDEALQGPKVPAALPMRRRQRTQAPITSRGSGEWLYADPVVRQPLARRGGGVGAPILLVVLGLLVISILVFLLPALLGGGPARPAAVASPSAGASQRPAATRAPQRTFDASPSPSVAPEPEVRVYTVKPGNTLSFVAERFDVSQRHLQCLNVITNVNLIQPGQKLLIPPEGFACPSGWRDMTPPPIP
ncbi:MAG TPA: LysM domain-containing protein, partial [Vicinamibacteria bacterium]